MDSHPDTAPGARRPRRSTPERGRVSKHPGSVAQSVLLRAGYSLLPVFVDAGGGSDGLRRVLAGLLVQIRRRRGSATDCCLFGMINAV